MESQKTLLSIKNHPLRAVGPSGVDASQLAQCLEAMDKSKDPAYPDDQAVRFYALNQIIGLMSSKFTTNETLPEWGQKAVALYSQELYSQHKRLMWYTFLVTSREWRHLKSMEKLKAKSPAMFTSAICDLHPLISDSQDDVTLNKWLSKVPAMPLTEYLSILSYSFHNGSWTSSYGGVKWGAVVDALQAYIRGDNSAEVFIDTAYTLCHNNGPIFNKNMQYHMYTSKFATILDVQRSGQVCEGLVSGELQSKDTDLSSLVKDCQEALGLGSYVDWYKVEELGALGAYGPQKSQQDKKYGKKPVVKLVGGTPAKVNGSFEWYPGIKVDTFTRMAA